MGRFQMTHSRIFIDGGISVMRVKVNIGGMI